MTKRYQDKRGVSVEEDELPSLSGDKTFKSLKFAKGTVQFSQLIVPLDVGSSIDPKLLAEKSVLLEWQGFGELQADHGIGTSFGVLFNSGFHKFGGKTAPDLITEIKAEVNEEAWSMIEQRLSELDDERDESGHRLTFLIAVWAQLFAESFGEVWLAAMAQHAYFIEEDDFAFGYLIAQLDQKRENETHFLRGKKSFESAKMGGKARSTSLKPETDRTLAEIKRLSEQGLSVARSAELAYRNGFGTSAAANKRLWHRHSKK